MDSQRFLARLQQRPEASDAFQALQELGQQYTVSGLALLADADQDPDSLILLAAADSPHMDQAFSGFAVNTASSVVAAPGLRERLNTLTAMTWFSASELACRGLDWPGAWCVALNTSSGEPRWALLKADKQQRPAHEYLLCLQLFASHFDGRLLAHELGGLRSEIQQIARLQRELQPKGDPGIAGLEVAMRYTPVNRAGGDYFDIVPLDEVQAAVDAEQRQLAWGLMLADASGHGPAAAMETAMLDAVLRTYTVGTGSGPGSVLGYANRHLFTRAIRGKFITAFIVGYVPECRTLTYANAGHPPAMLKCSRSGEVKPLDQATGIPLMVMPDYEFPNGSCEMQPGDALVIYTDGIIEARNPDREMFGEERLIETIRSAETSPQALVAALENALFRHTGGVPLDDDLTILALRVVS